MNNPWEGIPQCDTLDSVNGKRVDSEHPHGLYWAVGYDKCYLLVMTHNTKTSSMKLPKLKGVEIFSSESETNEKSQLVLKLLDPKYQDIFYRLCSDIIEATKKTRSVEEALTIFVARTWRWHRLLKGGSTKILSPEEQKGLIGELSILKSHLLPTLSPNNSLDFWTGPSGSPKDFEIGQLAIEAKARRGGAKPYITISSEFQLETNNIDCLLYVLNVFTASKDAANSFTIVKLATDIKQDIEETSILCAEQFEALLSSYGLELCDDYSDYNWQVGDYCFYEVKEGFPRIISKLLVSGVTNVKYSISLNECSEFIIPDTIVKNRIMEAKDGFNT